MAKIQLIWIRIPIALILASVLFSSLSPAGAVSDSQQRHSIPAISAPKDNPVSVWSLSWTIKTVGSGNYYDGETTVDYTYDNVASMIIRVYADGTEDNDNFKFHSADNYTMNEGPGPCPYQIGASYYYYVHMYTTDPDQFDGNPGGLVNPGGFWQVKAWHDFDGSWSASLIIPTNSSYGYTEALQQKGWDCSGNTWDYSQDYAVGPALGCLPDTLQGNEDGTEFFYHAQDNVLYGGCHGGDLGGIVDPDVWTWSVDVSLSLMNDPIDLTVDRMEVTQGLQDAANSIPLVQGRRTVVRAYIGIGTDAGPVKGVTGLLEGYAGGTKLGAVQPFNLNEQIDALSDPNWQNIDDTLNFELPYEWTLFPSLKLVVEVNPYHSVLESNYDNNKKEKDKPFLACGGISIGYAPINYQPPGGYSPPKPSDLIRESNAFMEKIYPLSEYGLVYTPLPMVDWYNNINDLGVDRYLTLKLDAVRSNKTDYIFGWLPYLAYTYGGAWGIGTNASFANDDQARSEGQFLFAHEVGHNLGFGENTGQYGLTTDGAHWFDVYDQVIKPVPATVGGTELIDFMVQDTENFIGEPGYWISPSNYRALINKFCHAPMPKTLTDSSQQKVIDNLIITGVISNTSPVTGALDPLFHLSSASTPILPNGSQYCVNLKDISGNLLSQYCFNESFENDSGSPASTAGFSMVVPYPIGLNQVELTHFPGGPVLSSRVSSGNSPSVTVTFPNEPGLTLSGDQTITWDGSDLDGDPLTYYVLYSRDNGSDWIGIGRDITGTSYTLNFSELPGTNGFSGQIKVMISDGFYSVQDTSTNLFAVDNKPPYANIFSPPSGESFTTGPKIVLEGSGVDLEDGSLSNSSLSWVSSVDGVLGTGHLLEVNLTPGVHIISLTVTDSQGLTDTDSIQITVVQSTLRLNQFLPVITR